MKNTALNSAPKYFHTYINLVADVPLMEVLPSGGISLYLNEVKKLTDLGLKVYASGKWTVNEMVQHLIDTERIFVSRALRFVREDKTDLPGYDHTNYVSSSRANEQSLADLMEEYEAVRRSTLLFFRSLNEEELLRTGKVNGKEISVLAVGYILVGHPTHHFNVLMERYFECNF